MPSAGVLCERDSEAGREPVKQNSLLFGKLVVNSLSGVLLPLSSTSNNIEAQRSGFDVERRRCGANEHSAHSRMRAIRSQRRRQGGGCLMSTSELFQFCLVIIGIISLFLQAKKK